MAETRWRYPGRDQPSPEAEDELCRQYASRIRLYGLRHLRDSQSAADLVQDVLVRVIEALRAGRVREPERLESFILGTCRMVVGEWRSGAARRHRLLDRFGRDLPAADASVAVLEDAGRLRDCLEALAERERSVVVLAFYVERTSAEIGAELGLSEGNVRVIRHRALGRLRDCMGVT